MFGALGRFRGVGTRATTVGFVGKGAWEPFQADETGKKGVSFNNGRFSAATPVVGYGIEGGALVGQSGGMGGLDGKGRDAFAAGDGHCGSDGFGAGEKCRQPTASTSKPAT